MTTETKTAAALGLAALTAIELPENAAHGLTPDPHTPHDQHPELPTAGSLEASTSTTVIRPVALSTTATELRPGLGVRVSSNVLDRET